MNRFEQFIQERKYLTNVSPRTIEWYRESFKWMSNEQPDTAYLKDFVMRMRQDGLKASSCNNRIRAINSYLHWAAGNTDIKCSPACTHLKVPKLKEPQRVLPTFTPDDIKKFIAYKPKLRTQQRLQLLILLLADTGCRIDEALSLKWTDVDFDNLLLTLHGKGVKDRRVPFSFELRKRLFKYRLGSNGLVFQTRDGHKLDRHVVLRDVKLLCEKLHITIPERTLHAIRHTFAINYLRNGGSVFHLQKSLGHTSLEMTRKYANLMTEDLQKIHPQVSLLSA